MVPRVSVPGFPSDMAAALGSIGLNSGAGRGLAT